MNVPCAPRHRLVTVKTCAPDPPAEDATTAASVEPPAAAGTIPKSPVLHLRGSGGNRINTQYEVKQKESAVSEFKGNIIAGTCAPGIGQIVSIETTENT